MKCNSASLFLLINIKFIPNNMISRRGIHFFLKCYNCINRASFFLLYHLLNFLVLLFNFNLLYFLLYFLFIDKILRLLNLVYKQILLSDFKLFIGRIEQTNLSHHCLMPRYYVELCLVLNRLLVQPN